MTSEQPAQRLGRLIRERRKALKLTQADVQTADGPSTATLRLIENGKHTDFRPSTSGPLEAALQWARGSIDAILTGGEPTPIDVQRAIRSEAVDRLRGHVDALNKLDGAAFDSAAQEFWHEGKDLADQIFGDRRRIANDLMSIARMVMESASTLSRDSAQATALLRPSANRLLTLSARLIGQEIASNPRGPHDQLIADLTRVDDIRDTFDKLSHLKQEELDAVSTDTPTQSDASGEARDAEEAGMEDGSPDDSEPGPAGSASATDVDSGLFGELEVDGVDDGREQA